MRGDVAGGVVGVPADGVVWWSRPAERGATVSAVGSQAGYRSPFTFSTAVKRTHGVKPRGYRSREVSSVIRKTFVSRSTNPTFL